MTSKASENKILRKQKRCQTLITNDTKIPCSNTATNVRPIVYFCFGYLILINFINHSRIWLCAMLAYLQDCNTNDC